MTDHYKTVEDALDRLQALGQVAMFITTKQGIESVNDDVFTVRQSLESLRKERDELARAVAALAPECQSAEIYDEHREAITRAREIVGGRG